MPNDAERNAQRGIASFARKLGQSVTDLLVLRPTRTCSDCGDRIYWTDRSECGSHEPIDSESVTHDLHVETVKDERPKAASLPEILKRKRKEPVYDPEDPMAPPKRQDGGYARSQMNDKGQYGGRDDFFYRMQSSLDAQAYEQPTNQGDDEDDYTRESTVPHYSIVDR